MKKIAILLVTALAATFSVLASVTISVTTKTVQKTGGGGTITITGTGEWTAVSDASWITVKSGASGDGDGKVIFTVAENATADTRIGHINITDDNVYTITQYGYTGTISPTSTTCDLNGESGTISVTVDAGVSWTAVPNVDWISTDSAAGTSVGTLTYTVAPYNGVVTRVGSVTIAGQTFEVTQTGVDVNLEPKVARVGDDADIVQIEITALSATKWSVTPNASWISILDKEQGYGDYVLTLAVNANPSYARRTGTVSVGTATLTVIQDGKDVSVLAIDPENATASASGAYGNVAVYATPDAPWTAESLASWLTISEGAEGAGNGNIKYVISPNPTLSERTGVIRITPPYKTPDPDLYAGLACRILAQYNVEGNESRSFSHSLATAFDGSFSDVLTGTSFPAKSKNDFAMAFNFMVGELGRVNRLARLNWLSVYLNEGNQLCMEDEDAKSIWQVSDVNTYYTLLLNFDKDAHELRAYAGKSGAELSLVAIRDLGENDIFDFSASVVPGQIELGHTTNPSDGYLTSGKIQDFRMWMRCLSDDECASVELNKNIIVNAAPRYKPESVVWHYFPFDGSCYGTWTSNSVPQNYETTATGWSESVDRFGFRQRSFASSGTGAITIKNFSDLFQGSYVLNNGKTFNYQSGNYYRSTSSYYYPYVAVAKVDSHMDATWSFWMRVDKLPTSPTGVFSRSLNGEGVAGSGDIAPNQVYSTDSICNLLLLPDGTLTINHGSKVKNFPGGNIAENKWTMVTIVGVSGKSLRVYVDGVDAGNDTSGVTLGYLPPTDCRYYYYVKYTGQEAIVHAYGSVCPINADLTVGGWNGAFDDFSVFEGALTSEQVRSLYAAEKAKIVDHVVTQGVQTPTLNVNEAHVPAEGDTLSVNLTLAQNVNWTTNPNDSWIHITDNDEGAGSATIALLVDANPTVISRTGTVEIASLTYTVIQEGLNAEVSCEKTFFDSVESDMGSISVYTEGSGEWTAVSNDDWIQIDPDTGSGNGSGDCWFYIDDYSLTTQSRTGSITIAGKTVYITQCGYKLSIDPAVAEVGSNAGAGEIGVAASIDQVWEVISECDWITIVNGRSGIGNGKVQYQFKDNTTGAIRTGTIIIGGQRYTLTQRTTLPLATETVGDGTVVGQGDYSQGAMVTLTATPEDGYVFSHWQGDAVGVSNQVTVAMDVAKNVTAVFIPESAAEQLAADKAAQGGFYTRDQIHNLELGNLVLDVDSTTGQARIGVKLQETSDLDKPDWKPVNVTTSDLDVGSDGTVGIKAKANGNAKFFRVVTPSK